jgi:electron transfer flavoprotein alpha subunit
MEKRKDLSPVESATALLQKIEALSPGKGKIIVSGGRGIGSSGFFDELREVADLLGGEIGSSRANVEAGWIERKYQVGQTGRSVAPDIYLACGISGSPQHRAGIRGAAHILAINMYENAPIFEIAEFGIVGDATLIVPEMIGLLKATEDGQRDEQRG